MKYLYIIPVITAITVHAHAQTFMLDESHHAKTGDTQLDRAVQACDRHTKLGPLVYPENPGTSLPNYDRGWEVCSKIIDKWQKSEIAKQQREEEKKDKADLDFINNYAKTIQ